MPEGSHSSKASNQEEATAHRNSGSNASASVRMLSMGAESKLNGQRIVSNGSRYELSRTSSRASGQRLPDVSSQPPPDSFLLPPITRRLVQVDRNKLCFVAAQNGEYPDDGPTTNFYARNINNEDVLTSAMAGRRLPEIPRVVQPIPLDEVRRFLDECRLKLDKGPEQGDQLAGQDLQPPRTRRLREPTLDPAAIHREDMNVERPRTTRTANRSNGLRAAIDEQTPGNLSNSALLPRQVISAARAVPHPYRAAMYEDTSCAPTATANVSAAAHAALLIDHFKGMPFVLMNM
jgi:hypothetical protein